MNVVFYNRDYTGRIQRQNVTVERYSWNMIGGPDKCYLQVPKDSDAWELTKLLRCPVEIYGGDGKLNWWGYVNKVVVPSGISMIGVGLDEMYNYITVRYDTGTTAAGSDATSISEYGQKEKMLTDSSASSTDALYTRDLYLTEHRYARPEAELSGGREYVSIECYGWYKTLDWRYYTSTDTNNVENTTQISSIITSVGAFLRGSIIEDTAGITSSAERDGTQTALACINRLLGAGTNNTRPLLANIDKDRYLHVYERDAEPESADYFLKDNGDLLTPVGEVVLPEHCICAKWVRVQGVPDTLGGFGAMRPLFIESSEYRAATDTTVYRPAGSFEAVRLSKYIADVQNGNDYDSQYNTWETPLPPAAGVAMSYAMIMWDGSTQDYSASSGITFSDISDGDTYVRSVTFDAPSDGLYLVGAQVQGYDAGAHTSYVTIDGLANYTTNLESLSVTSPSAASGPSCALSVADWLTANTTVTLIAADNGMATWPATVYFYAIKLSG